MSYFRPTIDAMSGYTPGEQPNDSTIIKLNTNENPYPASAQVAAVLADTANLNRYPNPVAQEVRVAAAALFDADPETILVGNGSDDVLAIIMRAFVDQGGCMACLDTTYSLYPVLAAIQGARVHEVPLTESFGLPAYSADLIGDASVFFITSPNAPLGNSFDIETVAEWCENFDGIVVVDEAYADFADANCAGLVERFGNVIISRTLSKSYSLAGIRVGFAYAQRELIAGMMKVKDSYNVNAMSQACAVAALRDQAHMKKNAARVRATRERVSCELRRLGFAVVPSDANFVFAKPPLPAKDFFDALRDRKLIVRYFPGDVTGAFVRVTIGTDPEMDRFLAAAEAIVIEALSAD
ncbi:MAG: histidinol-phosphate aminotransferase [Rhodothermales bacterium]|jgi:histidinol-phosphate aminotransferase